MEDDENCFSLWRDIQEIKSCRTLSLLGDVPERSIFATSVHKGLRPICCFSYVQKVPLTSKSISCFFYVEENRIEHYCNTVYVHSSLLYI